MNANMQPCRSIVLEGPPEIDQVTGGLWLRGKSVSAEAMALYSRSVIETPGGDERHCGLLRVTVELLES